LGLALVLALAASLLLPASQANAATIAVHKIEWSLLGPAGAGAHAADTSPTPFDLPLHWSMDEGEPLRRAALHIRFAIAAVPDRTWALLLSHSTEGGRVSLNGRAIGDFASESEVRHVAWRRPLLLTIDPSQLTAGDNEIVIETSYGPGAHTLSGVEIGPLDEIWNQYALQFFLEYTSIWIGATIALLTALVFGALWLERRESVARLLALAAVFWLLFCAASLVEIMPLALRVGLQVTAISTFAAFSATLAITLMRLSSLSRRREEWLICLYAALGPVMCLASSLRAEPYLQLAWQPGLLLILGVATTVGLYRRTQAGAVAPHPLVLIAAVILLFAGLLDYAGVVGLGHLDGTPAMSFAAPLMLLALATPLVDGFIKTMHEAEVARVELETRVREREQLLKRNFERLRESERVKAEAQERQRIMQDMHDGLGSQLMSSLMLVERGAVSNDQFAQILRESIDDMRLAIDALAAEDADLAAALGNLRFRMEPRLRAAGMELTWDARRLPEELGLHPDVVLPILRIVQEALTNALKHSRARAVRVTLGTEGAGEAQSLDIRISDNGRGIAEERVGGRGLLNMRNRAQKIGAQLKLETAPNVGTTIHLRTRIGPANPSTRGQQTVLNTQAVIERAREQ
jgi:signal transduction histidine kinase